MLLASAGCKVALGPKPCNQNELWLWGITSLDPIASVLTDNVKRVSSLAFSPDSKMLAVGHCSRDEVGERCTQARILLWDVKAARPIGELAEEGFGAITSLAFSRDGKSLAAATYDGKVGQWDVATRKLIDNSLLARLNRPTLI
jgi:WD40 repeat protein